MLVGFPIRPLPAGLAAPQQHKGKRPLLKEGTAWVRSAESNAPPHKLLLIHAQSAKVVGPNHTRTVVGAWEA